MNIFNKSINTFWENLPGILYLICVDPYILFDEQSLPVCHFLEQVSHRRFRSPFAEWVVVFATIY